MSAGEWRLVVRAEGAVGPSIESAGPLGDALASSQHEDFERAVDRGDALATLEAVKQHEATIRITARNDAAHSCAHWIRSVGDLTSLLSSAWLPAAIRLATGPRILVVDDLDGEPILASGLVVIGASDPQAESVEAGRPFIPLRSLNASISSVPSPLDFNPDVAPTSNAAIVRFLWCIARMLTWAALSTSCEVLGDGLEITIAGARLVTLSLSADEGDPAPALIGIFRWVSESSEVERLEFAQQALSLALVTEADIASAPEPALRTARSLYELSRRGAVAEALAARRAARDAAIGASRAAAMAAREAGANTGERIVVQVAAAAGVLLAEDHDAISRTQAGWLLMVVAVICIGSLAMTVLVTLRSAQSSFDSQLADLDQFRDTLATDDIAAIKASASVKGARHDLVRVTRATWVSYLSAGGVALVCGVLVLAHGDTHHEVPNRQTRVSTTSSAAPNSG